MQLSGGHADLFARDAVMILSHDIDATLEVFEPGEEFVDHFLTLEQTAVLRNDHLHIESAHHVDPIAAYLVGVHVALVETFHVLDVCFEVLYRTCAFIVGNVRSTNVTGEEDLAHRIVEVEVAFRVKEMGRQCLEGGSADFDIDPFIGNADEPPLGGTGRTEMGNEALPQVGYHHLGTGTDQPLVE